MLRRWTRDDSARDCQVRAHSHRSSGITLARRDQLWILPAGDQSLVSRCAGRSGYWCRMRWSGSAKQNACLHLSGLTVGQVRLEAPLLQGVRDGFGLIGERTDEVDVFDQAVGADDHPDGDGVVTPFGQKRI